MTDPMVSSYDPACADRVEVITSVQRRRHWTTEEKVRIVEETYLPGNSVSIVARRHGISANQLFTWRRLMARGAFTAAGAGEEVGRRRAHLADDHAHRQVAGRLEDLGRRRGGAQGGLADLFDARGVVERGGERAYRGQEVRTDFALGAPIPLERPQHDGAYFGQRLGARGLTAHPGTIQHFGYPVSPGDGGV